MKIRSLKLQDAEYGNQWFDEAEDRWEYADFKARDDWRRGWISFDCALYNREDNRVYLGITSFDADIFKAFDRNSDRFVDLGYARVADPFDAKFHRSLARGRDGCLYAAPALLHDVDRWFEAPGGAIVKYDPKSGAIRKLGVPLPHVYIQSLVLDDDRDTAYCLCFAPEHLAAFDLKTGRSRDLGLIGTGIGGMTQGENLVLDDAGCVWSNWALTRAWQNAPGVDSVRLCKYDPRQDRIVFFSHGLPHPEGGAGFAKSEGLFNFHDGFIYGSGANGSLYRVSPETGEARFLFTPTPDRRSRLSSMARGEEGVAYGITGRDYQCELMRVDYRKGTFEKIGPIKDADGNSMYQCHHVVLTDDGVLYACENDNPYRSSYLWEISDF